MKNFLESSSVYSCHLFLISSSYVRSIRFLSFIEPIFAWNVPLVSLIFLKRSLVFPILLFSSISLHSSLRKAFLSLLAILWNSAFRYLYLSFSPLLFTNPKGRKELNTTEYEHSMPPSKVGVRPDSDVISVRLSIPCVRLHLSSPWFSLAQRYQVSKTSQKVSNPSWQRQQYWN